MTQNTFYRNQSIATSATCTKDVRIQKRNNYICRKIQSIERGSGYPLKMLELSVGTGDLSSKLFYSFPNIELTCTDISQHLLDELDNNLKRLHPTRINRLNLVQCNFDLEMWRFENQRYDYIFALDILEHLFDVFQFIEFCAMLLNKGGHIFISVPNMAYIKHRIALLTGNLPVTSSWFGTRGTIESWATACGWDGGHLHNFTIPMMKQLILRKNLKILEYYEPGAKFEMFRNIWPNLLFSNPLFLIKK